MADTLKTLKCPACGKDMEKVFIPSEGINLDICTQGCGGIYFDNREFQEFDEKDEDISKILEKISNRKFEQVDTTAERTCPNCGAKMVKNHSSVKQIVEVDECYSCGGKFLDRDELVKIIAEYNTEEERSADMLKHVYTAIGSQLEELDKRHAKSVTSRSSLQKLFLKLAGA